MCLVYYFAQALDDSADTCIAYSKALHVESTVFVSCLPHALYCHIVYVGTVVRPLGIPRTVFECVLLRAFLYALSIRRESFELKAVVLCRCPCDLPVDRAIVRLDLRNVDVLYPQTEVPSNG